MNLEGIRAFVAVTERGQFQLAGGALGITQQAVSKRIAGLEAELGTVLFERTPSGAVLTRDGHTFLPHARAILGAVRDGFDAVQPSSRPLRVDVLSRRVASAALLRTFKEQNPTVAVEMLTSGGAAETIASLDRGEIDAGYAYLCGPLDARRSSLESAHVYFEPLEVIVGGHHPLAGLRAVRLEQLSPYRAWIPGIVAGTEWEAFYRELGEAFDLHIDPRNYESATESVFDTIAGSCTVLTIVGEKSRVAWPAHLGLVRLPITAPVPLYPWSIVWRSDTEHRGVRRLVEHSAQVFAVPTTDQMWLPTVTGPGAHPVVAARDRPVER